MITEEARVDDPIHKGRSYVGAIQAFLRRPGEVIGARHVEAAPPPLTDALVDMVGVMEG